MKIFEPNYQHSSIQNQPPSRKRTHQAKKKKRAKNNPNNPQQLDHLITPQLKKTTKNSINQTTFAKPDAKRIQILQPKRNRSTPLHKSS